MFCTKCAATNPDCARFCAACGIAMALPAEPTPSPQDETGPLELYQAVVGATNQGYYLSRFTRYLKTGRTGVSWHWPAFFLTGYWFLYRKMWRNALIYFVLPYIGFVPLLAIVAYLSDSSENAIGLAYVGWVALFWALPPMFANALYFRHCRDKIDEATAVSTSRERQVGELLAKGGTSNAAAILAGAILIVATVGMLAAIAIPAYQRYATKAKLSHAEAFGMTAAQSLAEYYYKYEKVPESLAVAGFSAPLPAGVREVSVNPSDGSIAIRVEAGDPAVDGRLLLLVPSLDENQNITWTCLSREIAKNYLPSKCRNNGDAS